MVGGMPNSVNRDMERRKYISKVGYLYPERDDKLSNVTDLRSLVGAVEATPYERILAAVAMDDRNEAESSEVTIDDVMLSEASKRYSVAFEGGFHVGCFFAYLKLKEQEIKNVTWLAELVQMQVSRNLPGWSKFITPFMYHSNDIQSK
jgi:V-type H+-transporting ATPase subunit d